MDNITNSVIVVVMSLIIFVLIWLIINSPYFGIKNNSWLSKIWQSNPIGWAKDFVGISNKTQMIPKSEYCAENIVGEKAAKYRSTGTHDILNQEKQIVYATEEVMGPINGSLIQPNTCGCTTCINGQYVPQQELSEGNIQQNEVKPEGEFTYMSEVALNNQDMWRHPQGSRRRFSYIEATNQTVCPIKGKPTYNSGCKACGDSLPSESMFDNDDFYGFDRVAPFVRASNYGSSKEGKFLVDDNGKLIKKADHDMWKKGADGKVYRASVNGNKLSYTPLTNCKLYD